MIDKLVGQSIKYTKELDLVLVQRQNYYATSSTNQIQAFKCKIETLPRSRNESK